MILRILIVTQVLIILTITGCDKNENIIKPRCIKGKFIGSYCEGAVIQILDETDIGRDWINTGGSTTYVNSVVASIDTLITKNMNNHTSLFSKDSIFYFEYEHGGYARKQYNFCEPSPYITITNIFETCLKHENE